MATKASTARPTGLQTPIPLYLAIISSAVSAVVAALIVGLLMWWWIVHRREARLRSLEKEAIAFKSDSSSEPSLKDSIRRIDFQTSQPTMPTISTVAPEGRDPNARRSLATHPHNLNARRMSRADLIGYNPRPAPTPSFPHRYPAYIAPPSDALMASQDPPKPPQMAATGILPLTPRPTHPRNRVQNVRNTIYTPNGQPDRQGPPPPPLPRVGTIRNDPRNQSRAAYAADSYVSLSPRLSP
ncbi:hypothetical protein FRB94_001796 [Tulasnella sp. JGI-2019a]|nr:hypothetical protein FRB93_003786 [Tulasnella sp. JGI-2019a]KAG9005179.1 hypothetical protein FRB94_001796 [Tulasnella sp. JGI-2019a]KAG9025824.1 hypothetical protein FRB95_009751 [Tulasnella sp. JGI-2019a]